MNPTMFKALVALLAVLALFVYSATAFGQQRSGWALLLLGGALCFAVVVLTHVAEALRLYRRRVGANRTALGTASI